MIKRYRWKLDGGCLRQLSNRDRKRGCFVFTDEQSGKEHKILVEITNPSIRALEEEYGNSSDIVKVLCWIAKEHGLKKGIDEIKISTQNYSNLSQNINLNDINDEFCYIELEEKPFGFHSKKREN